MQNIRRQHGQSAYAYAVRSSMDVPAREQGACIPSSIRPRIGPGGRMYRSRTTPVLASQHTWGIGIGQGFAAGCSRSLGDEAGSGVSYSMKASRHRCSLFDVAAMQVATTVALVYQRTREREESQQRKHESVARRMLFRWLPISGSRREDGHTSPRSRIAYIHTSDMRGGLARALS